MSDLNLNLQRLDNQNEEKTETKPKSRTHRTNKNQPSEGTNIKVGNISNSTGVAIGENAQAHVNQYRINNDFDEAFALIEKEIARIKVESKKGDATKARSELKNEAQKGEYADWDRVQSWFSFLANIAPDVWEVAVDPFINPVKGVSTIFKKIAEKAKAEMGK